MFVKKHAFSVFMQFLLFFCPIGPVFGPVGHLLIFLDTLLMDDSGPAIKRARKNTLAEQLPPTFQARSLHGLPMQGHVRSRMGRRPGEFVVVLYAIRWRPVLVGYEALLVGFSVKLLWSPRLVPVTVNSS